MMNDIRIDFAPDIPLWLLAVLALGIGVFVIYGLMRQMRGGWIRAMAGIAMLAALSNPSILREERDPLKTVVAVVVDRSASQKLDGRDAATDALRDAVIARISKLPNFEVREVEAQDELSSTSDVSTALFRALTTAVQDIPRERLGGAILLTDGQVHDIPADPRAAGYDFPVHALITGRDNERDRRMAIVSAPRYGVVGEQAQIAWRVIETGFPGNNPVNVEIFADGERVASELAIPGQEQFFTTAIPHGGKNIFEFRAQVGEGEISTVNNRAFVQVNGIRENLRVLLVSGEPHAGERTWRNLLKSDPSVDLVHFTILRPPEKQDGTPINQLSLIAFPTRELFVEKIDEFDLIIFDRYRRRNVLPLLYYDNMVSYVEKGGAIMIASGPEFGEEDSIAGPLQPLLPADPDGSKVEAPFKPLISEAGLKHPVTRGLDGWRQDDPQWGRWFRSVGVTNIDGDAVMEGVSKAPLLLLHRHGEGRVALFLSDHTWLWARGYEGGGPYVQLLRRTSHWLMKEPELDEERLNLTVDGKNLLIERQSLEEVTDPVTLIDPTGKETTVTLQAAGPGQWRAEVPVGEFGLYTATQNSATGGDKRALAHAGPPNPREFADVVSTTALLSEPLQKIRGAAIRATANQFPGIVPIRPGGTASGPGWIGLENANASVLKGISRLPLFTGLLGLALLLAAISAMWAREGR